MNTECMKKSECTQPRLRIQLDQTQIGQQQTASWPMKPNMLQETVSTFISHWSDASVVDLAVSVQLTGWDDAGQKACDRTPRILPIEQDNVLSYREGKTVDLHASCFNITLVVRSLDDSEGTINTASDEKSFASKSLAALESFLGNSSVIFWISVSSSVLCILSIVGLVVMMVLLKKEKSKKKSSGFNPYYIHLPIDKHPISGYDIPYTRNLRDMYDATMKKSDASSGVYSLSTQMTPMTSGSNIGDITALLPSSRPPPIPFHLHLTPSPVQITSSEAPSSRLQNQNLMCNDEEEEEMDRRRELGKSYIIEQDILVKVNDRIETEIV
ncbi:hypothetical protein WR25_00748 [Diploscapter pachys]|uniref:C2 domain-containing protein n=1 Tax=Diploscapter pachys TaxID=2018661 RepID=A0A2A2LEW6_9BILA|nr:hypothetical protein WR25_00748 [Diploscapter pachys]